MICLRNFFRMCIVGFLAGYIANSFAQESVSEKPFVARALTKPGEFTLGIEGPNCDAAGNIFAVNFAKEQTIGKVTPLGKAEVFLTLPGKSTGNGIVFTPEGIMYVADYVEHKIWRIDPKTKEFEVFAHEPKMSQPNDLAIAPDGTLYASDPDWKASTGRVWKIDILGNVTLQAEGLGTANGIEVSPDGKWLYVNESAQRNVWKFPIQKGGNLGKKQLIKQFPDFGFDGMRCDAEGNLYISRYGKGTVVIMTPEGKDLREVKLPGNKPSNVCFGGPDGMTVYVTEVENTQLVQFRVEVPGLAWKRFQDAKARAK
jgi:sugar lactone lactonase YvrE